MEETNCEKYLGVIISNDLKWATHVQSIVSDSYQKLGMINRIFHHSSRGNKEKLYNHLVRSKLEYCCAVWDPNQICLKKSIERVQKKASRIVLGHSFDNYGQAMTDLKWSRLHDRREYHRNVMCYKKYHEIVDIHLNISENIHL